MKIALKVKKTHNQKLVRVRGVLKHNQLDRQDVFYFQGEDCVYKMLSSKKVERMSYPSLKHFLSMLRGQTTATRGRLVYEDEVANYKGEPLDLPDRVVEIPEYLAAKFNA